MKKIAVVGIVFTVCISWSSLVGANPLPGPYFEIKVGPGTQDVTIIEECYIDNVHGQSSCSDPEIYRDGKKITCKGYNEDFVYTPYDHGDTDLDDGLSDVQDVVQDAMDNSNARDTRNDFPEYSEGTQMTLRCIDRCVPLGIHHYRIKTPIIGEDIEKIISISVLDPECSKGSENTSESILDTSTSGNDTNSIDYLFRDSSKARADSAVSSSTSNCDTSSRPGNVGWLLLFAGILLLFKRRVPFHLKNHPDSH